MNNRKATAAITTAAVGMALGTAAYMLTDNKQVRHTTKNLKKNTGKALHQVGNFIENMSYMMR